MISWTWSCVSSYLRFAHVTPTFCFFQGHMAESAWSFLETHLVHMNYSRLFLLARPPLACTHSWPRWLSPELSTCHAKPTHSSLTLVTPPHTNECAKLGEWRDWKQEKNGVSLTLCWLSELDAIVKAIRENQVTLVFIPSPNNPTGTTLVDSFTLFWSFWFTVSLLSGNVISEEEVRRLCSERCVVVIDEAYAEFSETTSLSDGPLPKEFPNLVICRTFRSFPFES